MTAIRPARPEDAAALAQLARAAYARYVPLIGREPPPMLQDFPADIGDGVVWVAGNGPDGYVVCRPKGGDWLIENVAVAPDCQGCGIGNALISFAEAQGRARGFARVTLYTNARMTDNLAMYPRLGYTETGRREEMGLDRVFFVKNLS